MAISTLNVVFWSKLSFYEFYKELVIFLKYLIYIGKFSEFPIFIYNLSIRIGINVELYERVMGYTYLRNILP